MASAILISMIKSSVNDPATKADVNKTVKSSEKVLRAEILRVEERLERVEGRLGNRIDGTEKKLGDKIDGVEVKLDKISNQLDGFVGRVDDLTNENEIGADQIHRLREDVKGHEKRIAKLESPN